jgi:hypothetical protein
MTGPSAHDHGDSHSRCEEPLQPIGTLLNYEPHSEQTMPTVSESLAKLSQRAKEAEDHVAAARHETRAQIQARVIEARAAAQRRAEEMKARGAKAKDDLDSAWASLQAQAQQQFEKMRAKIDEKRDDHDAKAAQRRAERAEAHAAHAASFAQYAVDEADAAALEAAEARKIADTLHPSTPPPKGRSNVWSPAIHLAAGPAKPDAEVAQGAPTGRGRISPGLAAGPN